MSSKDLKATLQAYDNCILTTLLELKRSITLKLNSTNVELVRLKSQLNDIQINLGTVQDNIEAINKTLLPLDTSDLEVLEVQGQTEFHHLCRGLRLTPNFHFNLYTRFPIRNYSAIQFKESVWKTQACEIGGYTFKGEVRTQAFKDGYAKVILYGYRRDVMASTIASLKGPLRDLNGSRHLYSSRLEDTKPEIWKLEIEKAKLLSELDGCRKDLQSIELLASINDTSGPEIFLRDRSISGLAVHHGLTLMVADLVPKPSNATTWLFKAFESELSSALTYLKDMKENYTKANFNLRTYFNKLPGQFEGIDRNTSCPNFASVCSKMRSLAAESNTSQVLDLRQVANSELQSLDSSLKSALSLLKAEMETIEPATNVQTAMHVLGDLRKRVELTKKELAACNASVVAVNEGQYIGVIASKRMASTTTEAWMDAYRGAKAGMVTCAWAMFPPCQDDVARTNALLQLKNDTSARKQIKVSS